MWQLYGFTRTFVHKRTLKKNAINGIEFINIKLNAVKIHF